MIAELKRGACHLWHWQFDAKSDAAVLEAGISLLDTDELARHRRYLVHHAASTFLGSRILLRSILSAYWNVRPEDWCFAFNQWGRPRIANPGVPPELNFNLSNKPGFAVCLVGYGRELGVDAEDGSKRLADLLHLASRFFSSAEAARLRQTREERQLDRFYEFWTLKESYIKARGQGLKLGLSRFSFSVAGDRASVRFDDGFDDVPDRWDFRLYRSELPHLMASSIELDAERSLTVEVRDASEIIRRTLANGVPAK